MRAAGHFLNVNRHLFMNYDYDYCHLITATSSTTALVLHCCCSR